MRLIMMVPGFPRLSETFIVNKFVGLVDAGHDVHLVYQNDEIATQPWSIFPALSGRPKLRARVHRQWRHDPAWLALLLWLPALVTTFLRAPWVTARYWNRGLRLYGLALFKRFYLDAAIIALSPDVVHFEFGALAVGRTYLKQLLGCRLSASFRGYDISYVGLENPRYYDALWRDADALHLLGEDLWRRALRRGCPPDKPHTFIPPAIDVHYFAGDLGGHERSPVGPDRPLRILSVGRLEWVKGYEYALRAARLLRDRGIPFEYRIIGEGKSLEGLAFTRYQLGLEGCVIFLRAQPHPVVTEEMRWADVFLHAAVSEGFCNAVLEAQAMRLPVVASDADGLGENVMDGVTGFIVPRRDPAALADKLALLAGDVEARRRMGNAGRERVRNYFQLPQQIAAFGRFYEEMATNHAD